MTGPSIAHVAYRRRWHASFSIRTTRRLAFSFLFFFPSSARNLFENIRIIEPLLRSVGRSVGGWFIDGYLHPGGLPSRDPKEQTAGATNRFSNRIEGRPRGDKGDACGAGAHSSIITPIPIALVIRFLVESRLIERNRRNRYSFVRTLVERKNKKRKITK